MSNRKHPAPKGPSLVPVFVAITVVVVAALAVAVMQNMDKESKAPDPAASDTGAPTSNPFGDIDNDPKSLGGTRTTYVDTAPAGLMETPVYRAAKALADDGKALVKEAEAARAAGDEDTFQAKGRKAKDKLELAFEKTADWIMDLQDRYPNDRQLNRIEKERMSWDRALRKVRKVH